MGNPPVKMHVIIDHDCWAEIYNKFDFTQTEISNNIDPTGNPACKAKSVLYRDPDHGHAHETWIYQLGNECTQGLPEKVIKNGAEYLKYRSFIVDSDIASSSQSNFYE